ncbi:paREP2b [Pyrobaculum aerophilum str. IM2]|jgi:hypothetical protein|nr:paREP2b [Pyrobaculum aerophilum str. IM2]
MCRKKAERGQVQLDALRRFKALKDVVDQWRRV